MNRIVCAAVLLAPQVAFAVNDGLCRTPIMGMNSWTAFGQSVTEKDLIDTGNFFVSSGLRDAGYKWVNTDDGWDTRVRGADGKLQVDTVKFPSGMKGVVQQLNAMNLSFGIYTAESSVVCSGRPGTLFNEVIDAQTFADWGVGLVKNDNCGEYSYGNTRFHVFADAVAATGHPMIISTEPFSLVPNPGQARFAHYWRTGNDINANWRVILNRIDINNKWAPFAGPGHFNDPDMLQVGNGPLTMAEQRAHFGLWAITKSTLILGSKVAELSGEQLALISNKGLIAVNQDSLGVQAVKVAINGSITPQFVGIAPCSIYEADPHYPDGVPGPNGVTKAGMVFHTASLGKVGGVDAFKLVSNATGMCVGMRLHVAAYVPMLVECGDNHTQDPTQSWTFPTTAARIGAIQSLAPQFGPHQVLAVANSTIYGSVHGKDTMSLLDSAYGDMNLGLAPYNPEPPCTNRNCQDYDPLQSWYYSAREGTLRLAAAAAEGYRCYEPGCYQLTSHYAATDEFCLATVASISAYGTDPTTDSTGGTDVYAGPLADGAYVFGMLNRGAATATVAARWAWAGVAGFGDGSPACVRELFSGKMMVGAQVGGIQFDVASHDLAVFKVVPGAASC